MTKLLYPDIYFTLFLLYPVEDLPPYVSPLDWTQRNFPEIQSALVISNSKGFPEIRRDIRTSTYQICRIEEKLI